MKVPPKRKGNANSTAQPSLKRQTLNESPSEKEGKFIGQHPQRRARVALNESPSEKEGKSSDMPPLPQSNASLNESPSEKEGKCLRSSGIWLSNSPQ